MTFSLGVLQKEILSFTPPLPQWKREAIFGVSCLCDVGVMISKVYSCCPCARQLHFRHLHWCKHVCSWLHVKAGGELVKLSYLTVPLASKHRHRSCFCFSFSSSPTTTSTSSFRAISPGSCPTLSTSWTAMKEEATTPRGRTSRCTDPAAGYCKALLPTRRHTGLTDLQVRVCTRFVS